MLASMGTVDKMECLKNKKCLFKRYGVVSAKANNDGDKRFQLLMLCD